MIGRELLHKMKEKVCFSSPLTPDGKKGGGKFSRQVTHGSYLMKGKSNRPMEDYLVSELRVIGEDALGLFAIYDGHMGHGVANYLQLNLFDNILKQGDFWTDIKLAIKSAYQTTDKEILEKSFELGKGGSTAVNAILINGQRLVVANVGDSRAVISKKGVAKQLSVDHDPTREKELIESKGGFVSNRPGDVPRVDGQLAVARAFGDKSLKKHVTSEPDIAVQTIDDDVEFLILASDGVWTVMSNQDAVNSIKAIKDPHAAAKRLVDEALSRKSRDDISCVVVRFQ
ncbi:probable protein phosphatase 2C 58 isoform X1 [Salvia hispanica]|uniref:probable protein phosphatase 2C 58 isoform X1 n=1 Tax=Salvia hispanica TaxID=49212 RepID=UPI002009B139|nr:probable protein phosphatase 2C 58 isoform X1 [Salvia hispanica]